MLCEVCVYLLFWRILMVLLFLFMMQDLLKSFREGIQPGRQVDGAHLQCQDLLRALVDLCGEHLVERSRQNFDTLTSCG